jgi:hypothetical protein
MVVFCYFAELTPASASRSLFRILRPRRENQNVPVLSLLYDARSVAAHERSSVDRQVLLESMELLRRLIIKIVSDFHVPSKDELESCLFGG